MSDAAAPALKAAVEKALSREVEALVDVRHDALEYDAFLAHRAVTRISGSARADGERIPWAMIEKTTEGPHLAVPYLTDNGDREYAAYASGLLDDLAPAVRAPRVYGAYVERDGRKVLWLEEIHHDGARPLDAETILAAARDLGGLAGRWLGRDVGEPWLWKLAVDVADTMERGTVPRRGSLPDESPEHALDELIVLVDVLLQAAERVLD